MSAAPHLLHVFSTFVPAGPETRTVQLVNALGNEFRHTILAIDGRTSAAAGLGPEAPARVIEAPPRAGSLATVRRLRTLLTAERPDVVLTYNWGAFDAVLAARSLRHPGVVHHEDGFTADEAQRLKPRRNLARRLFLRGVRTVVVPSARLEGIARDVWHVPEARVLRIPNGVRMESYEQADGNPALRAELGIPAEATVIGSVGHLRAEKNPLRLVRAAELLPPELGVHLLVLGDGPERAALEARAANGPLRGRIHLAGHVTDPRPSYRAMDVFALPSDTEQMPVALLEAMASGLAAVCTRVGDVPVILPTAPEPPIVPLTGDAARDDAALAEALRDVCTHADLRAELGRANRARVAETFTFEAMLTAYRNVYRTAAQRP